MCRARCRELLGLLAEGLREMADVWTVLLSFLQIHASFAVSLPDVPWPEGFVSIVDAFSIFFFDFVDGSAANALVGDRAHFASTTVLFCACVLAALACIPLGWLLVCAVARPLKARRDELADRCCQLAIATAFVLYPTLSARLLRLFYDRSFNDVSALAADVRLDGDALTGWRVVGALFLALYTAGIPIWFAAILWNVARPKPVAKTSLVREGTLEDQRRLRLHHQSMGSMRKIAAALSAAVPRHHKDAPVVAQVTATPPAAAAASPADLSRGPSARRLNRGPSSLQRQMSIGAAGALQRQMSKGAAALTGALTAAATEVKHTASEVKHASARAEAAAAKLLHLHEKRLMRRHGLLFAKYEPQCWWFELVELARKLALASLLEFVSPGSVAQVFFGVVVALIALLLTVFFAPYNDPRIDFVAMGANGSTLLTLICALALSHDSDDLATDFVDAVSAVVIALQVLPLVVALTLLVSMVSDLRKAYTKRSSRRHLSAAMRDEPPTPAAAASTAAAIQAASEAAASQRVGTGSDPSDQVVAIEAATAASETGEPVLAGDSRPWDNRSNSMMGNTGSKGILSHAEV
tara:strand:+ start:4653 stop:6398 length:1746 start_codon:yes stop_codon:yes gene_type:complete